MADKPTPGKPFRGSPLTRSATVATILESAEDYNKRRRLQDEGSGGVFSIHPTKIQNDSGADRDAGEILGIGDLILGELTNDYAWFAGDAPAAGSPFGILPYPVPDGEIGPIIVAGDAKARVDITDLDHGWADVAAGSHILRSAAMGPIRILWRPAALGVADCRVSFVGEGSGFVARVDANDVRGMAGLVPGSGRVTLYRMQPAGLVSTGVDIDVLNLCDPIPAFSWVHGHWDRFGAAWVWPCAEGSSSGSSSSGSSSESSSDSSSESSSDSSSDSSSESSSDSSSDSSSESSSDSSSDSSSASSSESSTASDSLSASDSDSASDGSSKSSAIVPCSISPTGYVAWYATEATEVRFDDWISATLTDATTEIPIDPRVIQCCEPGSLAVIAGSSRPVAIGAEVAGPVVIVRLARRPRKPVQATLHLSGIRKGFACTRLRSMSREQFLENEKFWSVLPVNRVR